MTLGKRVRSRGAILDAIYRVTQLHFSSENLRVP